MKNTVVISLSEYDELNKNLELLEKALEEKARPIWVGNWPHYTKCYYFSDEDLEERVRESILKSWGVTVQQIREFQNYKALPWYKRLFGFTH